MEFVKAEIIDENVINKTIVKCIRTLSLPDWCMTQSDEKTNQYLLGYIDGLVDLGKMLSNDKEGD